jgi:hypothetical protein
MQMRQTVITKSGCNIAEGTWPFSQKTRAYSLEISAVEMKEC